MNTPEHLTPEKIAELRATFADSDGNNTTSCFRRLTNWHLRITSKAYVGMGDY